MNHHEVFIVVRLPVPIYVLQIYAQIEDIANDPYEAFSDIVSGLIMKRYDRDMVLEEVVEDLLVTNFQRFIDAECIGEGFDFIVNLIMTEVEKCLDLAKCMKNFQCVSFNKTDSVVVSFFSDGKEHAAWLL